MTERTRRAELLTRALHEPAGLTYYEFTRGFPKREAEQFWVDAKALGFRSIGRSKLGDLLLALPSKAARVVEADPAITPYHQTREGGLGCPENEGGPHYFAFIDPNAKGRICIDCGMPE
jgi:hypothetical protein